jgi:tungstate transport system ATP-binding protein
MVDQHPILFTTTVFKNLEFGLKVRKIAKNERERMIAESLEMVGMQYFAQAPAHRLSGGETQRVALARAFAVAPKVLLCDEPTANVDEENQTIILQILRQINELKGISILFTTHDRAQALSLARQTLILNRGRIVPEANQNNKN